MNTTLGRCSFCESHARVGIVTDDDTPTGCLPCLAALVGKGRWCPSCKEWLLGLQLPGDACGTCHSRIEWRPLSELMDEYHHLVKSAVPPYIQCEMCGEERVCEGEWLDGEERHCLHCGRLGHLTAFTHSTGHTYWVLVQAEDDS